MSNQSNMKKTISPLLALLFAAGPGFALPSCAEDAQAPATADSKVLKSAGPYAAEQTTPPLTSTSTASAASSTASPSPATATTAATASGAASTTLAAPESTGERMPFRPGQTLSTATDTEDIVATYDIDLAKKQCAAYADSPEAAFILAVALTRSSRVEEALKEVQRARRLAETKGGHMYFDKMIKSYEEMLNSYPDDNRVRYGLAWAYYMKSYLLARQSRAVAQWKKNNAAVQAAQKAGAANAAAMPTSTPGIAAAKTGVDNQDVVKALSGGNPAALSQLAMAAMALVGNQNGPAGSLPHIPTALEKADAADIPQIKHYYELALSKLDEILKREPDDVWTIVYRAHLKAEYSGDLDEAMKTWKAVEAKHPNNPAPYFFLGEGYLKQGNLKESINHVSKAIALRALGN